VCQENDATTVLSDGFFSKVPSFLTPALGTAVANTPTKIRKKQYLTITA
jgi:hypothetical protein